MYDNMSMLFIQYRIKYTNIFRIIFTAANSFGWSFGFGKKYNFALIVIFYTLKSQAN